MSRLHRSGIALSAFFASIALAFPAFGQTEGTFGACCLPSGVCDEMDETDCLDAGGQFSSGLPCAVMLLTLDIGDFESVDLIGDPDNVLLLYDLAGSQGLPSGTAVRVLSVGYNVTINPLCPSWLSDARIRIGASGFGGLTLIPGLGDNFCPIMTPPSYADTVVTEFIAPSGYISIEFYESFNDYPDAADAVYLAGSQLSVTVARSCLPAVKNVTQDTYHPTIQEAIIEATSGDQIEASGRIYHETVNFLGKAVRVQADPGDTLAPIIDGGGSAPVVTMANAPAGTELSGFAITGGDDPFSVGGGILVDGAPGAATIDDCFVHNNTALVGGGIAVQNGASPLIHDCVLLVNAAGSGGGMYVATGANPTVSQTRLQGNTATSGAGIWVGSGATPTLDRIDASFNTATFEGSVLMAEASGLVTMTNSRLWNNTGNGGSGAAIKSGSGSTIDVAHCTIVANAGVTHGAIAGTGIDVNSCILWDNTPSQIETHMSNSVSFSDVQGGWAGAGTDNIDADPKFVLAPVGDLHLELASPCINRGDNASPYACPSGCVPPTFPPRCVDLDGDTRIRECRVDIGALETPFFRDCNDNGLSDACDVSPVFGFMCTVLGDLDFHLPGDAGVGVLITSVAIRGNNDGAGGPSVAWGDFPLVTGGGTFAFDASYTSDDVACPAGGSWDYPVFYLNGVFYGLNRDGSLSGPSDGTCLGGGTYDNGNQGGVVHYVVDLEALAGPGPYLVGVGVMSVDTFGGAGTVTFSGFAALDDDNGNGVPDECDCAGDTNGDGDVDVNDLNNVILDWGTDGSAHGGDITGTMPGSPPDGVVNVNDLNAVFVNWGVCAA